MVNCKGISRSSPRAGNQEICRYCRTQVCEECYTVAKSRNTMRLSELAPPVRHQHACSSCVRLHPEAKELRSPPRERRPSGSSRLSRLNSAPVPGGPRIDSLSNMAREHSTWARGSKPSTSFLAPGDQPEQELAVNTSTKPPKDSSKPAEQSTVDVRRRRHTSAIAPTSRSVDFAYSSKQSKARHLLRANATELQAARRQANATELHTSRRLQRAQTTSSCDFTGTTPRMDIRDATATKPKGMELTMMDLRDVPKSQSCDLTGSKPIVDLADEPTELELSTVDLRLPKYKVDVPTPTKRGRRASAADPVNSALTPISIENLAAIDAKLSSVELELKRFNSPAKDTIKKKAEASSSILSSFAKTKKPPVDFQLSTVDLRPRARRHTTTDTLNQTLSKPPRHENREPVVEEMKVQEKERSGFTYFQRKKSPEPIDFHLSTFDLKPPRHTTDGKLESNQVGVGRHESRSKKEKKVKAVPVTQGHTTPKYSKDEPCDLAYLDNFRSYTV